MGEQEGSTEEKTSNNAKKLMAWLSKQEMVQDDLMNLLDEQMAEEGISSETEIPGETTVKPPGEDKRALLKKKMMEWGEEGYNISSLATAIESDDMDVLWDKFVAFMDGIELMEDIKRKIKNLKGHEKEPTYAYIIANIKDPMKANDILEKLKELEKKSSWQARAEDTVRMVLETKLKDWQARGYTVESLRKVLKNGTLKEAENTFKEYEDSVRKIEELKAKLNKMDVPKNLEGEVAAIKTMMADPTNFMHAAEAIKELKVRVKKEARRREFIDKMNKWREEGFVVTRLEDALKGDLNTVMKVFFEFQKDIETLKSLESRVDSLLARGIDKEEIEDIYMLLNDPDKIPEINNKLKEMEKGLMEMKHQMMETKNTAPDKLPEPQSVEEGIEEGIDEDELIDNMVKRASQISGEAGSKEHETPAEVERTTPDMEELEDGLNELEDTIQEEAVEVQETIPMESEPATEDSTDREMFKPTTMPAEDMDLARRIQKLADDGFDTTALESMLKKSPREATKAQVIMAEQNAPKAREMIETLEGLRSKEHQEEIILLKEKLRNLKAFQMASKEYAALFNRIKSEKEKKVLKVLEHMKGQINEWTGEGYNIESTTEMVELFEEEVENWKSSGQSIEELQGIIDGDLDIVWEDFKRIDEAIKTSKELEKKLTPLLSGPMRDKARALIDSLKDPDSVELLTPEVEALVSAVESVNQTDLRLDELENMGWDMSSIRKEIKKNPSEAESVIREVEERLEEINEMKENINSLIDSNPTIVETEEYSSLVSIMNDPAKITQIREGYTKLKDGIQSRVKVKKKEQVSKPHLKSTGDKSIDELITMGSKAYSSNNFEEAISYFDRVLAIDPSNKKAKFYKKRALASLKKAGRVETKKTKSSKPRGFQGIKIIPELEKIKPDPNCKVCHGDGKCSSCGGTGRCYWCDGTGKCSECGGTGKVNGTLCASCNGTGLCEWCGGLGECYWCKGTGKCDKCVLEKAKAQGISL